jgi:hypothetical protein
VQKGILSRRLPTCTGPLASTLRRPGPTFVNISQTFRPSEGDPLYVIITHAPRFSRPPALNSVRTVVTLARTLSLKEPTQFTPSKRRKHPPPLCERLWEEVDHLAQDYTTRASLGPGAQESFERRPRSVTVEVSSNFAAVGRDHKAVTLLLSVVASGTSQARSCPRGQEVDSPRSRDGNPARRVQLESPGHLKRTPPKFSATKPVNNLKRLLFARRQHRW